MSPIVWNIIQLLIRYAFSVRVSSIPRYLVFNPTKNSHISRCSVLLLLIIPTNNYSNKIKESHHFWIIFVCLKFVLALFFIVKFTIDKPLLLLGIEHKIIIIVDMVFLFWWFKQLMIIKCKLLLLLSSCIYQYVLGGLFYNRLLERCILFYATLWNIIRLFY